MSQSTPIFRLDLPDLKSKSHSVDQWHYNNHRCSKTLKSHSDALGGTVLLFWYQSGTSAGLIPVFFRLALQIHWISIHQNTAII